VIRAIQLFSLIALLAACAGQPGTPSGTTGPASIPISEQAPSGMAEKSAKTHTELGTLYLQAGNVAVALEEARIATAFDPNYAPGHNLMGLVQILLNDTAMAKASFERAIQLAPGDPQIANDYGWFLCQSGREQEAMNYFSLAARNPLYKTPTRPYTNAGLCALRMKDDKLAEENFQRALVFDGSNVQAIFHLANLAYKRGDYFTAKRYLGEVQRNTEPNAESLWLGVRIERKLGDRQAEASLASQLRRKFAGSPEYQALMQGKYE
jgi:type IV pilus assembly protein PilF